MVLATGQDLCEQGDVWARIAEHRDDGGSEPSPGTLAAVQMLIIAGIEVRHDEPAAHLDL
ncbi:hypothetical protein ACFVDQ_18140 [Streptomyces sp. NPDC057684]